MPHASSNRVPLRQLPSALTKLSSLYFDNMKLQLQPGRGYQGVLGAAAVPPLKRLRFTDCRLLDGGAGLAAALSLLPGLEYLSLKTSHENSDRDILQMPMGVGLPWMQQLTYLELAEVYLRPYADGVVGLQPGPPLTRLVDLRLLELQGSYKLTARMLSGAQQLTRLELSAGDSLVPLEPAALAGKTLLQHLVLISGDLCDDERGATQLMDHLQHLQQLTLLSLGRTLHAAQTCPEVAAYSALTASSKLQHLGLTRCCLPAGVWQHMFPAGRQLPHLRVLDVSYVRHPWSVLAAAPEGTRLVSCCPGLQSLSLQGLQYTAEGLAALQGLSSLTLLNLEPVDRSSEGLEGVLQLTGLRRLSVQEHHPTEGFLLQLSQLRQLTYLRYAGNFGYRYFSRTFLDKVGTGLECHDSTHLQQHCAACLGAKGLVYTQCGAPCLIAIVR